MKTMIIDTSSDYLFISFLDNEDEIYRIVFEGKNNHSEHLIKFIDEGLSKTKLTVKDFDQIICGIGPGSYTGIRLSLSVAKMFAWTANIPLYTISSLDILSSGYYEENRIIITSLKAKKNYVYTNVIQYQNGHAVRIVDDVFLSDEEFKEKILSQYDSYLLVDEVYKFNAEHISKSPFLQNVEQIHQIVPNYLRSVL